MRMFGAGAEHQRIGQLGEAGQNRENIKLVGTGKVEPEEVHGDGLAVDLAAG